LDSNHIDDIINDVRRLIGEDSVGDEENLPQSNHPVVERSTSNHRMKENRPIEYGREEPMKKHKTKKKRRGFGSVIILVSLCLIAFGLYQFLAKQPMAEDIGLGARREGVSSILIAGTDVGGTRTDTIMLLTVDKPEKTMSLVSIPRDTLVSGNYSLPKINGCYGWSGGGVAGMEELMLRVSESIGFMPDGYALVELDGFVSLVDIMGGIQFDVPVDMQYHDPAQDLTIDLQWVL